MSRWIVGQQLRFQALAALQEELELSKPRATAVALVTRWARFAVGLGGDPLSHAAHEAKSVPTVASQPGEEFAPADAEPDSEEVTEAEAPEAVDAAQEELVPAPAEVTAAPAEASAAPAEVTAAPAEVLAAPAEPADAAPAAVSRNFEIWKSLIFVPFWIGLKK